MDIIYILFYIIDILLILEYHNKMDSIIIIIIHV
jgi:hypothetical protein